MTPPADLSADAQVTRFAPSPTGLLHLGHAHAALFAVRAARASGGRFLLRIEDIDRARCRPDYEAAIAEDLDWLGLAWEEPVEIHAADPSEAARQQLAELCAAAHLYEDVEAMLATSARETDLAVVATDTDRGVLGQVFEQILELPVERFLQADDVRAMKANDAGDLAAAMLPRVVTVALGGIANVERHHTQRRRRGGFVLVVGSRT